MLKPRLLVDSVKTESGLAEVKLYKFPPWKELKFVSLSLKPCQEPCNPPLSLAASHAFRNFWITEPVYDVTSSESKMLIVKPDKYQFWALVNSAFVTKRIFPLSLHVYHGVPI